MDFSENFASAMIGMFEEKLKEIYRMLWDNLISFVCERWFWILIILAIILVFAIAKAVITRRWGLLGHVLYNYLYLGTSFVIGLIFGPEVFTSNIFTIMGHIALYVICYFIVGVILYKLGFLG